MSSLSSPLLSSSPPPCRALFSHISRWSRSRLRCTYTSSATISSLCTTMIIDSHYILSSGHMHKAIRPKASGIRRTVSHDSLVNSGNEVMFVLLYDARPRVFPSCNESEDTRRDTGIPRKIPPPLPMIPYDPLPTLLSICTLAIMNHQRPGFRTRPCSGSAAFLAGDSLHHPHHLQDGPCQYRVIKTKLNHPRAIVFPILSSPLVSPLLLPSALQSVVLSDFSILRWSRSRLRCTYTSSATISSLCTTMIIDLNA